jgi:hypothetical protein
LELQTPALLAAFEAFSNVQKPLSKYFDVVPADKPGNTLAYDVVSYSQTRGNLNTRGGPSNASEKHTVRRVVYEALQWRDHVEVAADVLRDLDAAVEGRQLRGKVNLGRYERDLRISFERFQEWLRASALQGVLTYYPVGESAAVSELLLAHTGDLIAHNVSGAWNTAVTTEATARARLELIRDDFRAAQYHLGVADCVCDVVLINENTAGFIEEAAVQAGIKILEDSIFVDNKVKTLYGINVEIVTGTYLCPVTGTSTKYIPNAVAVFLDSNNARSGREMAECEAVDGRAAEGTTGLFLYSQMIEEAPAHPRIGGEWAGGPMLGIANAQYIMPNVNAGP